MEMTALQALVMITSDVIQLICMQFHCAQVRGQGTYIISSLSANRNYNDHELLNLLLSIILLDQGDWPLWFPADLLRKPTTIHNSCAV